MARQSENPITALVEGTPNRSQTIALGAIGGVIVGVLAALAYNRAMEENPLAGTAEARISAGEVVSIGLAILAIIRQVAELGRPPKKK